MNNPSPNKKQIVLGLALVIILVGLAYGIITLIWAWFASLNSDLAVGLLTASTTVIVATITLVVGKYFERVKEAETHLRAKKIAMYDGFLKKLFDLFHNEGRAESEDLVPFLQEWQRKLVVWGGPGVLKSFIAWKESLSEDPNAQSVFKMGEFFMAMRKDIGLSNRGIEAGHFSHLILRHASLFLSAAKQNPNITLRELGELEKKLGLE